MEDDTIINRGWNIVWQIAMIASSIWGLLLHEISHMATIFT